MFRNIGPFRGGRSTAVTGVRREPETFYFGGTGGGVWKTTDGGSNWEAVSDKDLKTGSIGAIAVSESDPNVVYVGTGESPIRGNVSHGDGVYTFATSIHPRADDSPDGSASLSAHFVRWRTYADEHRCHIQAALVSCSSVPV